MRSGNLKRIKRLEKIFQTPAEQEAAHRWDEDDLAILNALETSLGSEGYGPDDPRQREQFELTIARALEERGHSAAQIAQTLAGWMATYDQFVEEDRRQRRGRVTGYESL